MNRKLRKKDSEIESDSNGNHEEKPREKGVIEKEMEEEESSFSKKAQKSINDENTNNEKEEIGEESDDENVNIDILAAAGVEEEIEGDKFSKHFDEEISDLQVFFFYYYLLKWKVRDLEGRKVAFHSVEDSVLGNVLASKSIPKTKSRLVEYKVSLFCF